MRISDWSSDVCSSDLSVGAGEATDAVTVRRGAGWVNIPLSALAFRGADGRYALDGALAATSGNAVNVRRASDGDALDSGKDERKSAVQGKRLSVRVYHGGRRIL